MPTKKAASRPTKKVPVKKDLPEIVDSAQFPIITTGQLLDWLGLDRRDMTRLKSRKVDPLPIHQNNGRGRGKQLLYDARTVLAWCIRDAARLGNDGSVYNLDHERARLAAAQADGHVLKVAEMQGALLRREDVEMEAAAMLGTIRSLLEALPMELRRHEPDMSSGSAQRISETVARALNAMADFDPGPMPEVSDGAVAAA